MQCSATGCAILLILVIFVAQSVAALNVQLQLQLTTEAEGTQVNDAKLSIAAAAFLAIKHFNNRESPVISLGDNCAAEPQLNVEIVDTTANEKVALNALLTKREANLPDLIVGALTSYETIPLALAASVKNVPIISYGATSQTLDDSTKYSTFLRTIPSDKTVAEACCKLFSFYKYEYISILYADDEYGSAYKDAVMDSCRDLGIHTRAVSFKIFSTESVREAVTTLCSFETNVVVAIAFESDVETAVQRAFEIEMIGPGKLWVFTDAADVATLQEVATKPKLAEVLDGNMRVFAQGTVRGHGQFTQFSTRWKAVGGSENTGAADLAYINNKLNSSAALGLLDTSFFQGPDSSIDAAAAYVYDAIIAAGIAECEAGSEGLTDILDAMRNRVPPIEGVSGSIQFSENGSRDPRSAYFAVQNLVWDDSVLAFPSVGSLNATTGTLVSVEGRSFKFAGSSTTPPLDRALVVTNYNYISDSVVVAGLAMVAMLFLLSFSLLIWVVAYHKSRVVLHSQGVFLITLLCGIMLSSATILPLVIDDHHVSEEIASMACMASPWFYSLGFVIAFSALFAKIYRIAKLFNSPSPQRIRIRTRDLFLAVGVLAFLDGSLLAAWQLSTPLRWQRVRTHVDSFNRTIQSLGTCTDIPIGMESVDGINSNTFLSILACLHIGLLIYGNYLTYSARLLPSSFQESRYIALAMGSMLQLFMIGVPIVYAVADDPTARGLVMTLVVFLSNIVLIGAIMFPKLHAYHMLLDGMNTEITSFSKQRKRSSPVVAPGTPSTIVAPSSTFGKSLNVDSLIIDE